MNAEQERLFQRLRDYSFDDPHAARPFSMRLADEQVWTAEFTDRAVDEYRRFVLLAATAGHTACPSPAVDEVWHQHLLYTRDYWKRFCGDVLGRPLHHEPSRGGPGERDTHRAMYAQTLESYRNAFAAEPPPDIWPAVERLFGRVDEIEDNAGRPQHRSIGLAPARRWPWMAAGGLIALLPIVRPAMFSQIANPLNLAGPEFLGLYILLFCAVFCLALLVRYASRRWFDEPVGTNPKLENYEVAYLAGGPRRVVNAAVMKLAAEKRLKIDAEFPPRLSVKVGGKGPTDPLEREICKCIAELPNGELYRVHRRGTEFCREIKNKLIDAELIATPRAIFWHTVVPTLMMFALFAFGGTKIAIGISRGRPVMFLVLLCIATFVATAVAFGRSLRRTLAGDRELNLLEEQNYPLRNAFSEKHSTTNAQLPLAVGLFGVALLAGTDLGALARGIGCSGFLKNGCGVGCSGSGHGGGTNGGGGTGCGGGAGCGGGGGGCGGCSG